MTDDIQKKLISLAQVDRDATAVYDDALKHVTDEDVRTTFTDFRDEHDHHVSVISGEIVRLGGQPLNLMVDVMGHVAEWATSLRSMGGQHGALKAMRTAEKYHNQRYAEAVTWDVADEQLAGTLRRFYDEEKRHLSFIESKLAVPASSTR
jgi:rubrerythrin